MIALVLAISLFPQAFAVIAINMGAINESHSWYFTNVTVSRPDNDTIIITNTGGQDVHLLNAQAPFTIMINGNIVTNSEAIASCGLNISIDPAEGLKANTGASVTYTGDVLSNGGNKDQVVVFGFFKDGSEQTLYLNYV